MSTELIVFIASMAPLIEARISIIIGAEMGLNIWTSYIISLAGNIIITAILIKYMEPIINIVKMIHPKIAQLINWLLTRYHTKHSARFNAVGTIGLISFVALPIPGSGAYVGSVIAYILRFHKLRSFICISIGLSITGAIVSLGYLGLLKIL